MATQAELYVNQDRISSPLVVQHLAFLLMTAAVCLRRVAPLLATFVCSAGLAIQTIAGDAPVVGGFLAILIVLASLGYYASLRIGAIGMVAMLAAVLLADVLADALVVADAVGNAAIALMAWGSGHLIRVAIDRRVAAEVSRDRFARDAVLQERTRIARDLHDSVAHALTVMTLQAGGARERASQPVVAEALGAIESGGREALRDMHRFLHLLADGQPASTEAPGVADLDELIQRTRGVGLDVSLMVDGDLQGLPASVSSTAYRIVQEGLTNAVKHAAASQIDVLIRRDDTNLVVSVENDSGDPDGRTKPLPPGGRGLMGLRERLALFDGQLSAESRGDGWRLVATIPLTGSASA